MKVQGNLELTGGDIKGLGDIESLTELLKKTIVPLCSLRVSNPQRDPSYGIQVAPNQQFDNVRGLDMVEHETGSTEGTGWDIARQCYVVPQGGQYQIMAVGQLSPGSSIPSAVFYHMVFVNGIRARDLFIQSAPTSVEYYGGSGATDLRLEEGDTVELRYWHDAGDSSRLIQSNVRSVFSIRQLSA